MIKLILATASVLMGSAAMASQPMPPAKPAQAAQPSRQDSADSANLVCKYVVKDGRARDDKPYQLCRSPEYWAAKQASDDANSNRVECHYQEISGSRLRVGKRCMSADMWIQERQMNADYIQSIQAATVGPH